MNNLLGASVEINLFLLYFYVSLLILSALILNTNLMQKQEQKKTRTTTTTKPVWLPFSRCLLRPFLKVFYLVGGGKLTQIRFW